MNKADDSRTPPTPPDIQDELTHLKLIQDCSPIPMWIGNADGTLLSANEALYETLKLTADQVVGKYNLFQDKNLSRSDIADKILRLRDHNEPARFELHWKPGAIGASKIEGGRDRFTDVSAYALVDANGCRSHIVVQWNDITDRRVSEIAMETQAQLLSSITDTTPAIIYVFDLETNRNVYVNSGMERLLGFSPADVRNMGDKVLIDLVHPDDFAKVEETHIAIPGATDQAVFSLEYRMKHKDGSWRWLHSDERVFRRTADGSVKQKIGIAFDITEHRDVESALNETRATLAEAQKIAHVGSFEYIAATRSTQWSEEEYRIYGLDPSGPSPQYEDMLERCIHPDDATLLHETFVKAMQDNAVYELEHRIVHPDGTVRWVYDVAHPYLDERGELVRYVGVTQDITERKQAEAELTKLAHAVEQSSESIIITDTDANIEYVNEAFLNKSGYRRDEIIGHNASILKSGDTPAETYEELWRSLGQGLVWKGEFFNRRKDGGTFIEYVTITPIRQSNGEVSHYVSVQEDVTEKINLNTELEQHRHHLEELVEKRTGQLAEAQRRAEEASQAKSVFLANMSHEIRTPMNAILGLTYLMQRDEEGAVNPQMLDKIQAEGIHLLSIINDILDISKIESGKLALETTNFALAEIFDYVQSNIRARAESKGLAIHVDIGDGAEYLRGDPTRLRQALLNYAANAVKFTERGSIWLRSQVLRDEGDRILVRFEVEDSGIGIDPDKQADLFNVFEQADASTTRKHGGTGLGLTITRHLAQLMGGESGLVSAPGKGSTFWFSALLEHTQQPPATERAVDVPDAEQELRQRHAGARILLVEDSEINREVVLEILRVVDLAVDSAENGAVAVDKVRAAHYDLVLMDVQMPEMDGIQATKRIRSIYSDRELPILAMTANVFEDDRKLYKKVGMNAFIAKPIDPDVLFRMLAKWLPGREGGTRRRS